MEYNLLSRELLGVLSKPLRAAFSYGHLLATVQIFIQLSCMNRIRRLVSFGNLVTEVLSMFVLFSKTLSYRIVILFSVYYYTERLNYLQEAGHTIAGGGRCE